MSEDKRYAIGRFELILPQDHMLDHYQRQYRLYDWVLGELAGLVAAKYPDATAIDIGANIGDTAALLCRKVDIPVLCIEGHPRFLSYLRRNLERLPPCIEVVESLVGAGRRSVPAGNLAAHDGTASLGAGRIGTEEGEWLTVRPLAEILLEQPRFRRARLIKTDTDGSDFEILLSSLDVLRETLPVLYFEYDPTFGTDGARAASESIAALSELGYGRYLVYDNFGNFMVSIDQDPVGKFGELDRYLFSNLFFGRQVYYFDICAFSARDEDLCADLENIHRHLVEAALLESGRQF